MPSEEPNDDALEEEYSEPPSKKRKTQKKKKKKAVAPDDMFALEATLSEIAKARGFQDALIGKAQSHVNRSTQVRLKEPKTRKGKPKRPINCFLIYRKAYRCLVKELRCLEKNEQNVSRLCASSWNLESAAIQKIFEELALIDSQNHGIAFPGYKYAPSKSDKQDDKLVKGRTSTKTGRVTRKRKPASKVKDLRNFSEEVLQRAIDEQQSLPAEAVHPQPYWTPVAVETYPAPCPGEHAVYHGPHLYQTQTHYITYDNGYSQSKISSPVVVYGLFEGTENPDVNYNEGCIDPALLELSSDVVASRQPGVVYHYSVQFQRQPQPAPIEQSHVETGIPSWDDDKYAPFLSGTGDWKTKVGSAGELTTWATQVDA